MRYDDPVLVLFSLLYSDDTVKDKTVTLFK